jgi:hypothetical protein
MKKMVFPLAVPPLVLKAVFGEMSDLILKGSRVSSEKLISSGFNFRFVRLEDALGDVISR